MGTITYTIPTVGQPNSTEDPKIATALTTLLAFANGGIDKTNLSASSGVITFSTNARKILACAADTITGPISAGSSYSNQKAIFHGLGAVPVFIVASVADAQHGISVVGTPDAAGFFLESTIFKNAGTADAGTGGGGWGSNTGRTSLPIYWLAIA